jgi:hypothetical protein
VESHTEPEPQFSGLFDPAAGGGRWGSNQTIQKEHQKTLQINSEDRNRNRSAISRLPATMEAAYQSTLCMSFCI